MFTVKGLERLPDYVVDCPPPEVRDLPRKGNVYKTLPEDRMVACEDVLRMVKDKIARNSINLLPDFNDFDR